MEISTKRQICSRDNLEIQNQIEKAKEGIHKLEDGTVEIIQSEEQKEKKIKQK